MPLYRLRCLLCDTSYGFKDEWERWEFGELFREHLIGYHRADRDLLHTVDVAALFEVIPGSIGPVRAALPPEP